MLRFLFGVISTIFLLLVLAYFNELILIFIKENLIVIQAFGSFAIGISAIVALLIYSFNVNKKSSDDRYKASENFLREAIIIIERAYEMFTDNGKIRNPPKNDRLLWLTIARMLIRFKNMRLKITQDEDCEIINEHAEYWRFQFYKLLDDNVGNFTKEYFSVDEEKYSGNEISRNSIAVIFDFSQWNDGYNDPLHGVDDIELFARDVISIDQQGAMDFLEGYSEYWSKVNKRKAEIQNTSDNNTT